MKHAVKYIHCIGMVDPSKEQGSRLRDVSGRERRRMPMSGLPMGEGK